MSADSRIFHRWKPGEQILQQDLWGGHLITSRPVTVVSDTADYLALYSHPLHHYRSNVTRNRSAIPLSERIDRWMEGADAGLGPLEERVSSETHVLTLTPENSWHSVWLFWNLEWQLKTWYVNFQAPIERTTRGILVEDHQLDIVVNPDLSWSWKDEDEFEEVIARGFYSDSQISSIRAEANRMVRVIEDCEPPFSDEWGDWRPDADWQVPEIPEDWRDLERSS
jgi:hypothetical protein